MGLDLALGRASFIVMRLPGGRPVLVGNNRQMRDQEPAVACEKSSLGLSVTHTLIPILLRA
jgi:hypothetical protein